jgi:hypothetical protein
MRVLCYIKAMESLKPNPIEKKVSPREQFFAKFFSKHVAAALISLISFQASAKPIEAEQAKAIKIEQVNPVALEKDRRQALEDFKKLVDQDKIDELIFAQIERFGPAVGPFFNNRRIFSDVRNMGSLYLDKKEPGIFVDPKGIQFATMGSIVADAYKTRWQEHKESAVRPVKFKNIEAISGLTAKNVEEMLNVIYPKNYLEKCISEIEFVNTVDVREDQQVEILGQVESFGLSTFLNSKDGDLRASIKINQTIQGINRETFLDTLVHEIGHAFDPTNSSILASGERVLMEEDIYQRSVAPDRYKSRYVEGINIGHLSIFFKNANIVDPKEQAQYLAYVKANEYWAEIHRAFFDGPAQLQKSNPKDYDVVKKWVDRAMK